MSDHRKALHDLVDQAPERDLPRLLDLLTHSLFAVESESITFFPVEPGTSDRKSAMQTRFDRPAQQFTEETKLNDEADLQLRTLQESIQQQLLSAVERLGVSLESLGTQVGQGASGTPDGFMELRCEWRKGRIRHRITTFYIEKQEIITFEIAQLSEVGSELLYTVRVLTPRGEAERELTIPFK